MNRRLKALTQYHLHRQSGKYGGSKKGSIGPQWGGVQELRRHQCKASVVTAHVKDTSLQVWEYSGHFFTPERTVSGIFKTATRSLRNITDGTGHPCRGVRACKLTDDIFCGQTCLGQDPYALRKDRKAGKSIDHVREKYGKKSVMWATLLGRTKLPILTGRSGHFLGNIM